LIGVALASKADVSSNPIGMTYAMLGVLVTSFYQIWVKTKQTSLDASAFQLLYYQAPLSSFLLCFLIPFAEPLWDENGIFGRTWPPEAWVSVLLRVCWSLSFALTQSRPQFAVIMSSIMAFGVNLTIFLVIGKTSPVT
jgi:solute carrier family 35 protein E3